MLHSAFGFLLIAHLFSLDRGILDKIPLELKQDTRNELWVEVRTTADTDGFDVIHLFLFPHLNKSINGLSNMISKRPESSTDLSL